MYYVVLILAAVGIHTHTHTYTHTYRFDVEKEAEKVDAQPTTNTEPSGGQTSVSSELSDKG